MILFQVKLQAKQAVVVTADEMDKLAATKFSNYANFAYRSEDKYKKNGDSKPVYQDKDGSLSRALKTLSSSLLESPRADMRGAAGWIRAYFLQGGDVIPYGKSLKIDKKGEEYVARFGVNNPDMEFDVRFKLNENGTATALALTEKFQSARLGFVK